MLPRVARHMEPTVPKIKIEFPEGFSNLDEAMRKMLRDKLDAAMHEAIYGGRRSRAAAPLQPGELPYYDAAGRVVGGILPPQR